jgi:hypothetical protein
MRKIKQKDQQLDPSEHKPSHSPGGGGHGDSTTKTTTAANGRLGFRVVSLITVLGFLVWNLYLSLNLSASIDDLTQTLPTELALAVERGFTNAFFNASSLSLSGNSALGEWTESARTGLRHVSGAGEGGGGQILGESSYLLPHVTSPTTDRPRKLQRKLDAMYFNNGRFYDPIQDGMLWHLSDYAPMWMKKYFDWHLNERKRLQAAIEQIKSDNPSISDTDLWNKLTGSNATEALAVKRPYKFMVMQCIGNQDNKCGGTADRLKIFVYWVQQACENNRLLLIYWTTPGHLEDFLVPPVGGIDWRVPDFLKTILRNRQHGLFFEGAKNYVHYPNIEHLPIALIRLRVQSQTGLVRPC